MYGTLALPHRALDDLAEHAGTEAIRELRSLARPVEGLRVLNLSVTGFGTGTAELLNSSVPLLADLGIDARWQVVRWSEEAAQVSRQMYRALGGVYATWTQEMTDTWLRSAQMNAELLTEPFDVVIVHDPQPVSIRSYVNAAPGTRWVMDSHIDLSSAQDDVWMQLRPHVENYDMVIFPAEHFARHDITVPIRIVPPAIDPNSARNMPLPDELTRAILEQYGIDPELPLLCQISPCDGASDLVGAMDVWSLAKAKRPDLQLVIVLTTEPQDSEGRACFDELARRSQGEQGVFVLSVGNDLGNAELNVFQSAASVVMQKGLRKGFGLWVSDALWKRKPCVVAPAGGLTEQVLDGETGLIARTTEDFARAVDRLLSDPDLGRTLGESGHNHVAKRFLITRYLRDYLDVLNELHRKQ